jgi:hypothetical protein
MSSPRRSMPANTATSGGCWSRPAIDSSTSRPSHREARPASGRSPPRHPRAPLTSRRTRARAARRRSAAAPSHASTAQALGAVVVDDHRPRGAPRRRGGSTSWPRRRCARRARSACGNEVHDAPQEARVEHVEPRGVHVHHEAPQTASRRCRIVEVNGQAGLLLSRLQRVSPLRTLAHAAKRTAGSACATSTAPRDDSCRLSRCARSPQRGSRAHHARSTARGLVPQLFPSPRLGARPESKKGPRSGPFFRSGRQDLNLRPPGPQPERPSRSPLVNRPRPRRGHSSDRFRRRMLLHPLGRATDSGSQRCDARRPD